MPGEYSGMFADWARVQHHDKNRVDAEPVSSSSVKREEPPELTAEQVRENFIENKDRIRDIIDSSQVIQDYIEVLNVLPNKDVLLSLLHQKDVENFESHSLKRSEISDLVEELIKEIAVVYIANKYIEQFGREIFELPVEQRPSILEMVLTIQKIYPMIAGISDFSHSFNTIWEEYSESTHHFEDYDAQVSVAKQLAQEEFNDSSFNDDEVVVQEEDSQQVRLGQSRRKFLNRIRDFFGSGDSPDEDHTDSEQDQQGEQQNDNPEENADSIKQNYVEMLQRFKNAEISLLV